MLDRKQINTINGNMYIHTDDPTIGRSLELLGEYCQPEIDFLISQIDKNSIVMDIGANIGTHTIPLSKHAQQVLAFEPDEYNHGLLVLNCSVTMCKNVAVQRLALGNESIKVDTEFDYGKTVLAQGDEVMCVPLDTIKGFPRLDLLKIDVEGHELQVLAGATSTIGYFKPKIFIEMQNENIYAAAYNFLTQGHGYNVYWYNTATYNPNNWAKNKTDVFGPQHGVLNWFATQETCDLDPVLGPEYTVEKLVARNA